MPRLRPRSPWYGFVICGVMVVLGWEMRGFCGSGHLAMSL